MQKVFLYFMGTGYLDYYQANIEIYNACNELVFKGKTFNGKIEVLLEEKKVYCLRASLGNYIMGIPFYVNRDHYFFSFSKLQNKPITFLLTDYYYDNLPIMKGVLYFDKDS